MTPPSDGDRSRGDRSLTPAVLSVEDQILSTLRDEVLGLHLAPGERLRLDELSARYQVSVTPVRQAIRHLASEGLVTSLPRRGAHVSALTVDEIEEIQIIREGVERYLARLGAQACTSQDTEAMEQLLAEIDRAFERSDLDAYLAAQRALRQVCYAAANRPRLFQVMLEQQRRAERYLRYLIRDVSLLAASRAHQQALLEACKSRDAEAADTATQRAIGWTLDELRRLLADAPSEEPSRG
jgi:DNA-binding GntR family transcriptional regulator